MEVISKGCPFHGEDVTGTDELRFYCSKCNLLFTREELKIRPYE